MWDNRRWRATRFVDDKFILVLNGDTLTKESVAKALGTLDADFVTCRIGDYHKLISSTDRFGGILIFLPKTQKGGVSQLFGAVQDSTGYRDTISAMTFSYQPY